MFDVGSLSSPRSSFI